MIGLLLVAGGLIIVTGSFGLSGDRRPGETETAVGVPAPADAAPDPTLSPPARRTGESPPTDRQAPRPVAVRIPAIAVDADMVALGLRSDGSIEVPTDYSQTGWWADGPEPGEDGPAVVLGHVDSRSGPAVFHELTDLRPGDEVIIDRIDGSSVTYRVDRVEQHAKDRFPTEAVYGDTADPELRLVTCGGDFDRSARSYRDNIVVFASQV